MTEYFKIKYLIAALSAAIISASALSSGGQAFADAGDVTEYPEIFTESVYDNIGQITDYAVSSASAAIADGNKVIIISNDE